MGSQGTVEGSKVLDILPIISFLHEYLEECHKLLGES